MYMKTDTMAIELWVIWCVEYKNNTRKHGKIREHRTITAGCDMTPSTPTGASFRPTQLAIIARPNPSAQSRNINKLHPSRGRK